VFSEGELSRRIEQARIYVQQLALMASTSWRHLYADYLDRTLTFPRSLVLIHPAWYQHIDATDSVRGNRTFALSSAGRTCQSEEVWGYRCPFSNPAIHVDHMFPYAFGGPTEPDNAAWLCRYHNLAKGSDFHLLPLERVTTPWFDRVLTRVKRLVDPTGHSDVYW
jgi:hypothetical protein